VQITFDISNDEFKVLEELKVELHKSYPFFVLTDTEALTLRGILDRTLDGLQKQYAYVTAVVRGKFCKCSHSIDMHSPKGDMVCTMVNCPCLEFEEKTNEHHPN
jgi:hypothetical protein